ncbi:35397_t:CDS:2, partial [Racocetra persica]
TNKTRVVRTTVPAASFFQFFNPPPPDCEEDDDDLDSRLELDYQIGEDIKEKLIPRAIDWYTDKLGITPIAFEDNLINSTVNTRVAFFGITIVNKRA